jgi:hypothetical protein
MNMPSPLYLGPPLHPGPSCRKPRFALLLLCVLLPTGHKLCGARGMYLPRAYTSPLLDHVLRIWHPRISFPKSLKPISMVCTDLFLDWSSGVCMADTQTLDGIGYVAGGHIQRGGPAMTGGWNMGLLILQGSTAEI